jgi:hypothetical protein
MGYYRRRRIHEDWREIEVMADRTKKTTPPPPAVPATPAADPSAAATITAASATAAPKLSRWVDRAHGHVLDLANNFSTQLFEEFTTPLIERLFDAFPVLASTQGERLVAWFPTMVTGAVTVTGLGHGPWSALLKDRLQDTAAAFKRVYNARAGHAHAAATGADANLDIVTAATMLGNELAFYCQIIKAAASLPPGEQGGFCVWFAGLNKNKRAAFIRLMRQYKLEDMKEVIDLGKKSVEALLAKLPAEVAPATRWKTIMEVKNAVDADGKLRAHVRRFLGYLRRLNSDRFPQNERMFWAAAFQKTNNLDELKELMAWVDKDTKYSEDIMRQLNLHADSPFDLIMSQLSEIKERFAEFDEKVDKGGRKSGLKRSQQALVKSKDFLKDARAYFGS